MVRSRPQCILGIVVACFIGSALGGFLGALVTGPMSLMQAIGQISGGVIGVLAAMRGQKEEVNILRVQVATAGACVGTLISQVCFDDTLDFVTFVSAMLCATATVVSILMFDPNQPFTQIITEEMHNHAGRHDSSEDV
eukprot:GEMP01055093.1.p2 GENE.GEMP01055093.1~~GEMP01055093.1.p2  ORF type:complete len:138 (+),score=19.76 GEMP01055093.1:278-691(+)